MFIASAILLFPLTTQSIKVEAETVEKKTFEELAADYGVSAYLANRIIKCESNWVANAVGTRAVVGRDIGYWQLNSYYWEDEMLRMGWDIYDPDDNLAAGFWLMSQQGTRPWSASQHCWQL